MKSEILYRGKRLDNHEWVYGWYCREAFGRFPLKDCIIPSQEAEEGNIQHIMIDPNTVGKFSGLTDKTRKRIFEDDILKTNEDIFADAFVVRYGHCGGMQSVDHEVGYVGFYVETVGRGAAEIFEFGIRTDILYWLNEYEMEVIGNAHDTPELLDVKSR